MVNLIRLINFGRQIGYKNAAQILKMGRTVRKAVKNGTVPAALEGHLEFTTKQLKNISKQSSKILKELYPGRAGFTEQSAIQETAMLMGRKYAPKGFADDTKQVLDICFKKIGQKSGITEINMTNSNNSVLAKMKIFFNNAGLRIKMNGKSEIAAGHVDTTVLRHAEANPAGLVKNLEIKTDDKTVKAVLPKTKSGNVIAEGNFDINSGYANEGIKYVSDGRFSDVSEVAAELDKLKAMV